MNAEQITTIVTNLLTGSGVIFFVGMVIRGLKNQIDGLKTQIGTLKETVEVQQKTLEAVRTQVSETEKISSMYRKLFEELPTEAEKWKVTILKFKDERIAELEKAIRDKDEKHTNTVKIEIQELDRKYQALEDIPKLIEQFRAIAGAFEQRLSTVNQLPSYNEPAANDWVNEGSSLQAVVNKESALYPLLSAFVENDRKIVAAIWRFLDAGSKPATLKEIASKLSLHEFVVSNALDRLIKQDCVIVDSYTQSETTYKAVSPS